MKKRNQSDNSHNADSDDHSQHTQHEHHEHKADNAQDELGAHDKHGKQSDHAGHGSHVDHTGHEQMFRRRFWVCLILSIPVLLYSPMLQQWFGYTMPSFTGSRWIGLSLLWHVFAYGGVPFLQMAVPEIRNRQPGMMTLISLAITVALAYSLVALVIDPTGGFFWELVLLIDVMLLGHWMEMRSVRQASGALNELAKLMPDTAERVNDDGSVQEVSVGELRRTTSCSCVPGQACPPTARSWRAVVGQ